MRPTKVSLAKLELRLAIVNILAKYRLVLADGQVPMKFYSLLTLSPKAGKLMMRVEPRS